MTTDSSDDALAASEDSSSHSDVRATAHIDAPEVSEAEEILSADSESEGETVSADVGTHSDTPPATTADMERHDETLPPADAVPGAMPVDEVTPEASQDDSVDAAASLKRRTPSPMEESADSTDSAAENLTTDTAIALTGKTRRSGTTTTTGGTGAPVRNSSDDSTPFEIFADTTFAGTTATFSNSGGTAEPACRKACEDDPNCSAYVITAGSQCLVNSNGKFTPKLEASSTLYKKTYRVQTLQHIYGGSDANLVPLKLQNAHDTLCLENPGNFDGRVTTYECDAHAHRQWTLPFSGAYLNTRKNLMQIRSMNTSVAADYGCLEATVGSDDTMVELKPCNTDSTNAHQRWTLLESHQFRNERDGRCLELDDQKVITLQPCHKTRDAQKWWVTTNMQDRLEFVATQVDEANIGDQRFAFNPLSTISDSEFKCADCEEFS